jgi:hypothetical protein
MKDESMGVLSSNLHISPIRDEQVFHAIWHKFSPFFVYQGLRLAAQAAGTDARPKPSVRFHSTKVELPLV